MARRVLASELAGFDPRLAERLANLGLNELTNPLRLLQDFAEERGWREEDTANPTWHSGMVDRLGTNDRVHLAAQVLVSDSAQRHIDARLWQGQVALLFPLIEQKRRQILSTYRRLLWVPFDKGDGTSITVVEDLEITHLHYQLRNRVSPGVETQLRRLRDARNSLSHLDVVNAEDLSGLLIS